jgi:hypothetical protein
MKKSSKFLRVKFKQPRFGVDEQIMPEAKYDELRRQGVDCRAIEEKVY